MPHTQPDPSDMIFFAEVVERGGFAAAGRLLDIPRSRLSRRIAMLEEQMGVRLLQRTTRSLSLTSAGESFLRHCQAVRDAVKAASEAVADAQAVPKGVVRVSCPVTLAQSVVGELIPDFLLLHPQVQLELQVSNRVVNVVEEGVDVALRIRQSLDDSASCVVKKLDVSRTFLVASPVLLRQYGTPEVLQQLAQIPSIAMEPGTLGKVSVTLVDDDGVREVLHHQPRYIANDLMTLRFAALAGTGWCWLPDYMCVPDIRSGRLVRLLPQWNLPPGIVHAVFPTRRGMAPAVRSFLDYLGAHLPGRSSHASLVEVQVGPA
ncbi:DNA-binding transcriptional regulator, LysR family [Lampropedia hyalina DSM 16112]|uniref:DNA-binding transcriptional regulator, LysR family n=1 Tax=Lampropedia hyalina DSM 16112 TaxID=1122156 RepID=A0A1M5EUE2_9BURK|nr:LysR family transcriptional regulator [Lampropedia hyalina]SHF82756.1 DNA-binding transcriptional regulator, LysR family [Lampropedia hyalina DSM 16112]